MPPLVDIESIRKDNTCTDVSCKWHPCLYCQGFDAALDAVKDLLADGKQPYVLAHIDLTDKETLNKIESAEDSRLIVWDTLGHQYRIELSDLQELVKRITVVPSDCQIEIRGTNYYQGRPIAGGVVKVVPPKNYDES